VILYGEQIRAARGLIGWSQADLSSKADVGLTTIRRFEARQGPVAGTVESVLRIQKALETAGVLFLPVDDDFGIGVRLKHSPTKVRPSKK
jgi:transcriptional regulator with XRE-family HTH domain